MKNIKIVVSSDITYKCPILSFMLYDNNVYSKYFNILLDSDLVRPFYATDYLKKEMIEKLIEFLKDSIKE